MSEIEITVTGVRAEATATTVLTGGMVGLPVRFVFDESWEELRKTAVFRAGGKIISCPDIQYSTLVPWEVMEKSGCTLMIGVYGCNEDGTLAIPTLWAKAGVIEPGTDPAADPGAAPALPVWRQALDAARQAQSIAQNVRDDADAGMFQGPKGDPGLTPVRGVDYWTEADVAQIKSYVDETILGGEW